jgi:hypothetical protein
MIAIIDTGMMNLLRFEGEEELSIDKLILNKQVTKGNPQKYQIP